MAQGSDSDVGLWTMLSGEIILKKHFNCLRCTGGPLAILLPPNAADWHWQR